MLMIETVQNVERALIVIISENRESEYRLKRQEDEAVSLLDTLGIQSLSTLFFNVKERNSSTLKQLNSHRTGSGGGSETACSLL